MSRKNFGAKPFSYPQPVWIIATYDENGVPNAMNAAWGGISEMTEISVCLSPDHKTCRNFAATGAFTISMADAAHVAACDYVGIATGNKTEDKFAKAGFTATRSELVNAPIINELAVCMECRVISFDRDLGDVHIRDADMRAALELQHQPAQQGDRPLRFHLHPAIRQVVNKV